MTKESDEEKHMLSTGHNEPRDEEPTTSRRPDTSEIFPPPPDYPGYNNNNDGNNPSCPNEKDAGKPALCPLERRIKSADFYTTIRWLDSIVLTGLTIYIASRGTGHQTAWMVFPYSLFCLGVALIHLPCIFWYCITPEEPNQAASARGRGGDDTNPDADSDTTALTGPSSSSQNQPHSRPEHITRLPNDRVLQGLQPTRPYRVFLLASTLLWLGVFAWGLAILVLTHPFYNDRDTNQKMVSCGKSRRKKCYPFTVEGMLYNLTVVVFVFGGLGVASALAQCYHVLRLRQLKYSERELAYVRLPEARRRPRYLL
ncbi:uncharacterized protein C8A04DRAFT_31348 [Dichotomopilus funicola]|uniref:Uncharacterized protein n=1 Tax=Dichotomopilus funicola TaxID=1934379 RepID=A0AAN6UY82_9PEZI|nr:hypothetical protein C8A04DRAFT_31348 [Dichotomopilus funicola]